MPSEVKSMKGRAGITLVQTVWCVEIGAVMAIGGLGALRTGNAGRPGDAAVVMIVGLLLVILVPLWRSRWSREMSRLGQEVARSLGGRVAPQPFPQLLWQEPLVLLPHGRSTARLLFGQYDPPTVILPSRITADLQFDMSHSTGIRALLDSRQGRSGDAMLRWSRGMQRIRTENRQFDEWFKAYGSSSLGFGQLITPEVQRALLVMAERGGTDGRLTAISVAIDGAHLRFSLWLPPGRPSAQSIVRLYQSACEIEAGLEETCQRHGGRRS
jgi:hypothetical protein